MHEQRERRERTGDIGKRDREREEKGGNTIETNRDMKRGRISRQRGIH